MASGLCVFIFDAAIAFLYALCIATSVLLAAVAVHHQTDFLVTG